MALRNYCLCVWSITAKFRKKKLGNDGFVQKVQNISNNVSVCTDKSVRPILQQVYMPKSFWSCMHSPPKLAPRKRRRGLYEKCEDGELQKNRAWEGGKKNDEKRQNSPNLGTCWIHSRHVPLTLSTIRCFYRSPVSSQTRFPSCLPRPGNPRVTTGVSHGYIRLFRFLTNIKSSAGLEQK